MKLLFAAFVLAAASSAFVADAQRPYAIAHRGSSMLFPEHTLEAYRHAISVGADFIECDMVLTKDLRVICRHEPMLDNTTNAMQMFPDKVRTRIVDGYKLKSIFACDLTLAQIKKLKARQPRPYRDQSLNDKFEVPTLEEYIELSQAAGRPVGIIPEIKHSNWHNSLNIVKSKKTNFEDVVLRILNKYGYAGPVGSAAWMQKPVVIQSFEINNLKYIRKKSNIPLVQLMDDFTAKTADTNTPYSQMMTAAGLKAIKKYADAIGPWKNTVLQWDEKTCKPKSFGLVKRAHAAGLMVTIYTIRTDRRFIPACLKGNANAELSAYVLGEQVDGFFSDDVAAGVSYLNKKTIEGFRWTKTLVPKKA